MQGVKVLVVRGDRATGCAIGKMSKLTVSAANTVPYARVPLGIQTPAPGYDAWLAKTKHLEALQAQASQLLPGSPPPPIASAQVLAQVPTQPAQEYDYDVEYIQVPVQREVQVPVSIPVTVKKTVTGTEALQVRFLVARTRTTHTHIHITTYTYTYRRRTSYHC